MSYKLGHIFKIICKLDSNIVYIGSTFDELRKKWYKHKIDYRDNYNKFTIHKYFDKYGIQNFKIIHIKSYLCCRENNRDFKHLNAYETLWINKTKNSVNKKLPFSPLRNLICKLSKKKWQENNKYHKKMYDIEYKKKEIVCECGCKIKQVTLRSHLKTAKHFKRLL